MSPNKRTKETKETKKTKKTNNGSSKKLSQKAGGLMDYILPMKRAKLKVANKRKKLEGTFRKLKIAILDFEDYTNKKIIKHQLNLTNLTLLNKPSLLLTDFKTFESNRKSLENSRTKLLKNMYSDDIIKLVKNLRKAELNYNIRKVRYINIVNQLRAKFSSVREKYEGLISSKGVDDLSGFNKKFKERMIQKTQENIEAAKELKSIVEEERKSTESGIIKDMEKYLDETFKFYGIDRYSQFYGDDTKNIKHDSKLTLDQWKIDESESILKRIAKLNTKIDENCLDEGDIDYNSNTSGGGYIHQGGVTNNSSESIYNIYSPDNLELRKYSDNCKGNIHELHDIMISLFSLNALKITPLMNRDFGLYNMNNINMNSASKFPVFVEKLIYAFGKNETKKVYSYAIYQIPGIIQKIDDKLKKFLKLNAKYLLIKPENNNEIVLNNSCFRGIISESIYNTVDIFPAAIKYIIETIAKVKENVEDLLTNMEDGKYMENALLVDLKIFLKMLWADFIDIITKIGKAVYQQDTNKMDEMLKMVENPENSDKDQKSNLTDIYKILKENIQIDKERDSVIIPISEDDFINNLLGFYPLITNIDNQLVRVEGAAVVVSSGKPRGKGTSSISGISDKDKRKLDERIAKLEREIAEKTTAAETAEKEAETAKNDAKTARAEADAAKLDKTTSEADKAAAQAKATAEEARATAAEAAATAAKAEQASAEAERDAAEAKRDAAMLETDAAKVDADAAKAAAKTAEEDALAAKLEAAKANAEKVKAVTSLKILELANDVLKAENEVLKDPSDKNKKILKIAEKLLEIAKFVGQATSKEDEIGIENAKCKGIMSEINTEISELSAELAQIITSAENLLENVKNDTKNDSAEINQVKDNISNFKTKYDKLKNTKLTELQTKIDEIETLKNDIDKVKTNITNLKDTLANETDNNISNEDEVKKAFLEAIGDDSGGKGSVDTIIENVKKIFTELTEQHTPLKIDFDDIIKPGKFTIITKQIREVLTAAEAAKGEINALEKLWNKINYMDYIANLANFQSIVNRTNNLINEQNKIIEKSIETLETDKEIEKDSDIFNLNIDDKVTKIKKIKTDAETILSNINKDYDEKIELIKKEKERLAREEAERIAREEAERLAEKEYSNKKKEFLEMYEIFQFIKDNETIFKAGSNNVIVKSQELFDQNDENEFKKIMIGSDDVIKAIKNKINYKNNITTEDIKKAIKENIIDKKVSYTKNYIELIKKLQTLYKDDVNINNIQELAALSPDQYDLIKSKFETIEKEYNQINLKYLLFNYLTDDTESDNKYNQLKDESIDNINTNFKDNYFTDFNEFKNQKNNKVIIFSIATKFKYDNDSNEEDNFINIKIERKEKNIKEIIKIIVLFFKNIKDKTISKDNYQEYLDNLTGLETKYKNYYDELKDQLLTGIGYNLTKPFIERYINTDNEEDSLFKSYYDFMRAKSYNINDSDHVENLKNILKQLETDKENIINAIVSKIPEDKIPKEHTEFYNTFIKNRFKYEVNVKLNDIKALLPQEKCDASSADSCKCFGLQNVGNTCWMNSLLQLIFNMDSFKNFKGETNKYYNLIKDLHDYGSKLENNTFIGSEIMDAFKKNIIKGVDRLEIFGGSSQHDPNEFYSLLNSCFPGRHDTHFLNMEPIYINEIITFNNMMLSEIKATYFGVEIEIPKESIVENITAYLKEEVIPEYGFYKNDGYALINNNTINRGEKTIINNSDIQTITLPDKDNEKYVIKNKIIKKLELGNAPKNILINLKRFSNTLEKIDKKIEINLEIEINNKNYNLTSFICHSGTLSGGHYTNYSKKNNNKWYEYDDSTCKSVNINDIITKKRKNVYTLLYERNDTSSSSSSSSPSTNKNPEVKDSPSLKLITYNVLAHKATHHYKTPETPKIHETDEEKNYRYNKIVKYFTNNDYDVLCIQECDRELYFKITNIEKDSTNPNGKYTGIGYKNPNLHNTDWRAVIFYNNKTCKCRDKRIIEKDINSDGSATIAKIIKNDVNYIVASVHRDYKEDMNMDFIINVSAKIVNMGNVKYPAGNVIIAGDFNYSEKKNIITSIKEKFENLPFKVNPSTQQTSYNFDGTKSNYDHIFYSNYLTLTNETVDPFEHKLGNPYTLIDGAKPPSDHLAISAEFTPSCENIFKYDGKILELSAEELKNCILVDPAGSAFTKDKGNTYNGDKMSKAIYNFFKYSDGNAIFGKKHSIGKIPSGEAKINKDSQVNKSSVKALIHAVGPSCEGKNLADKDCDFDKLMRSTLNSIERVIRLDVPNVDVDANTWIGLPLISSDTYAPNEYKSDKRAYLEKLQELIIQSNLCNITKNGHQIPIVLQLYSSDEKTAGENITEYEKFNKSSGLGSNAGLDPSPSPSPSDDDINPKLDLKIDKVIGDKYKIMTFNVFEHNCKVQSENKIDEFNGDDKGLIFTQEDPHNNMSNINTNSIISKYIKDFNIVNKKDEQPTNVNKYNRLAFYKNDKILDANIIYKYLGAYPSAEENDFRTALITTIKNDVGKDVIKIANIHLDGGSYVDQHLLRDFDKNILFKTDLLKDVINEKPDIILGDFNSIYDSEKVKTQYFYFKNVVLKQKHIPLTPDQKQKINRINKEPFDLLEKSGYSNSVPNNERGLITNARGETIIDYIWYKKYTIRDENQTKIIKLIKDDETKLKFNNSNCAYSDHNPVIGEFSVIKEIILNNNSDIGGKFEYDRTADTLGGASEAKIVIFKKDSKNDIKFVEKTVPGVLAVWNHINNDSVENEFQAFKVYRALGLNVPDAYYKRIKEDDTPKIYSKFLENSKTIRKYLENTDLNTNIDKIIGKIKPNFIKYAVLSEFDLGGPEQISNYSTKTIYNQGDKYLGNLMINENDELYSVDVGGSLFYDAIGNLKSDCRWFSHDIFNNITDITNDASKEIKNIYNNNKNIFRKYIGLFNNIIGLLNASKYNDYFNNSYKHLTQGKKCPLYINVPNDWFSLISIDDIKNQIQTLTENKQTYIDSLNKLNTDGFIKSDVLELLTTNLEGIEELNKILNTLSTSTAGGGGFNQSTNTNTKSTKKEKISKRNMNRVYKLREITNKKRNMKKKKNVQLSHKRRMTGKINHIKRCNRSYKKYSKKKGLKITKKKSNTK